MHLVVWPGRLTIEWRFRREGADVRFKTHRYRMGGPWITRRVVHDIAHRTGISFRTAGGWRFLGLMVTENLREVNEPDREPPP